MVFWKKGLIVVVAIALMGGLGLLGGREQDRASAPEGVNPAQQIAADFFWLQAYGAWEAKSEEDFRYYAGLARWADPSRWFFIQESVGVMAYDVPVWRVGRSQVLEIEKRNQALWVLEWLDELESRFGDDFRWHLERGFLQLHSLKDPAAARRSFHAAAMC